MLELPEGFEDYIAPNTDRLAFLQEYLNFRGVQTSVIPIGGKKHLYVNFPLSSFNPRFKIKTIITHYDRVPNSPGANDNSAANFAVADFAVRLWNRIQSGKIGNVRIFFTDGEELGESGVFEQGAFGLAELFTKCGIKNDDVYVFDSCGRGTVPVLARAGLDSVVKNGIKLKSTFAKKITDLYERTFSILKETSDGKCITLPVPYSDNAGFLACGIPAVAITFLPENEASLYYKNLMQDKNLERAVMNSRLSDDADFRFKYEEKMPLTWRLFHTEYDNALSLTLESFDLLAKILDRLALLA